MAVSAARTGRAQRAGRESVHRYPSCVTHTSAQHCAAAPIRGERRDDSLVAVVGILDCGGAHGCGSGGGGLGQSAQVDDGLLAEG
jgi:hypothetical protein